MEIGFVLWGDEITGPGSRRIARRGSGFYIQGDRGGRGSFDVEWQDIEELPPADRAIGGSLDTLGEGD